MKSAVRRKYEPFVRTKKEYEEKGEQLCCTLEQLTMDELLSLSEALNDWSDKRAEESGIPEKERGDGLVEKFVCDIDDLISDILDGRTRMIMESGTFWC